jgi:Sulfotransferase domain
MNKIFQIGFHRCGTRTLYHFFHDNGIKSCHWENGDLAKKIYFNYYHSNKLLYGYDNYVFFSDMEAFTNLHAFKFYKLFNIQYPNSKFILNIRNVDDWILSRLKHNDGRYKEKLKKHHNLTDDELINFWKNDWELHIKNVMNYFKNSDNLLIFNIDKDEPQNILNFLELKLDLKFWKHYGKSI